MVSCAVVSLIFILYTKFQYFSGCVAELNYVILPTIHSRPSRDHVAYYWMYQPPFCIHARNHERILRNLRIKDQPFSLRFWNKETKNGCSQGLQQ